MMTRILRILQFCFIVAIMHDSTSSLFSQQISVISPTTTPVQAAVTITLTGTDMSSPTSLVLGQLNAQGNTTSNASLLPFIISSSATQIVVNVPASLVPNIGTSSVTLATAGGSATTSLVISALSLTTYQPTPTTLISSIATLVLGQSTFTATGSATTQSRLNRPVSTVVAPSGKVFVSDANNHRILRFASFASLTNGASAEMVFGQGTYTDRNEASGQTGLRQPYRIFVDENDMLWVVDQNNNRVLRFDNASTLTYSEGNPPQAAQVLGQATFASTTSGVTASSMSGPMGVWVVGTGTAKRLFVADRLNHRVLRFDNVMAKNNGASADVVFGQSSFTTNSTGTGANQMSWPVGVTVDASGTMWVMEAGNGNKRVIGFDDAATANTGASATRSVGSASAGVAGAGGTTATTLVSPEQAFVAGSGAGRVMWVPDNNGNRIVRFSNIATTNGGSADLVLGQSAFTTSSSSSGTNGLNVAMSVWVDASGRVWSSDFNNHRVMVYTTVPATTVTANVTTLNFGTNTASGTATTQTVNITFGNIANGERVTYTLGGTNVSNFTANTSGFSTNATQTTFSTSVTVTFTPGSGVGTSVATLTIGLAGTTATTVVNLTSSVIAPPAPVITSLSPTTIQPGGTITITGTNFSRASSVTVGGTGVYRYWVSSPTSITAVVGSSFIGSGNVVVTTPNGVSNTSAITVNAGTVYANAPNGAVRVLGQSNYTTRTGGTGASNMQNPNIGAVDPTTGKVFVPEYDNSRVLRFASYASLTDGSPAEAVFGQAGFGTSAMGSGAAQMENPIAVHVDGAGRLWVADWGNARVLRFDNASTKTSGSNADGVLGQSGFGTKTETTTSSGMRRPGAVVTDGGGRLWVADLTNNRVLRYDDAGSKANGANADGVLGQADFTSGTGALSAGGLNEPLGLAVNGNGTLWVTDRANKRILRYNNAAGKGNGGNADAVLGQVNFSTNTGGVTQSKFNVLHSIALDGAGRLWVSEFNSNRVLRFDNAETKSGEANADAVLGQPNFTSSSSGLAQDRFFQAQGVWTDDAGRLWISDANNNRVMVFDRIVPVVTAVSSVRIRGGQTLTITGTNLSSAEVRFFGESGTVAGIVSNSATSIGVTVPIMDDARGRVFIRTPDGTTQTDTIDVFGKPVVTSMSSDLLIEGTVLTINGFNLDSLSSVRFFDTEGVFGTIISANANQVQVRVPSALTMKGRSPDVTGQILLVTNTSGFTRTQTIRAIGAPFINSFSGVTNTTVGVGGTLTINAGAFLDVLTEARFFGVNGALSPSISTSANNVISITVPSNPTATTGQVILRNAAGTTATVPITLIFPPTVTRLSTTSIVPGQPLTITGTNLASVTEVRFFGTNGILATITSRTAQSLVCTVPSDATGSGQVVVVNPGGSALAPTLTIIPAPTITDIQPRSTQSLDTVVITGQNFTPVTTVRIRYSSGYNVTCEIISRTDGQLRVRMPDAVGPGPDPRLILEGLAGNATSSFALGFAGFTIDRVSPTEITVQSTISLFGSNIGALSRVFFFGTGGAEGTIVSKTSREVVVRPPSNATGSGRIYAWSTMGDREFSPASTPISIVIQPTITSISANFAKQVGIPDVNIAPRGELITITGTNLERITEVRFFGASGALGTVISSSASQCIVKVPESVSANTGQIFIRNIAGTVLSPTVSFVDRPNITTVRAVLGGPNNPQNTAVANRKFQIIGSKDANTNTLARVTRAHFFGVNGVRVDLVREPDDERFLMCVVPTTATRNTTNDIDTVYVVSPTGYDRFAVKFVNLPRITSISPSLARPGDVVTLTGTDLDQLTEVRFFGSSGAVGNILFRDYTTARIELPAVSNRVNYNQRSGAIFANNPSGSSLTTLNFAILATPPVIDSIVPLVAREGDTLRLFGPNVIEILSVRFFGLNGTVAPIFDRNVRSVSVRVPSGMYGRKDNLGVFNEIGGNLTAQEVGIGRAPSSITTVTPSSFSVGDTILIRGTDLLYVNDVRFFGVTGTPGTILSQSQDNLVVAIPRVTGAQSGQIFVRSPLGSALSIPTASYRNPVADAPIITDVSGIGTTFATITFTAPTTGRGIPSSFRIEVQPTGTSTLATVPFNASTVSYSVQLRGLASGIENTVLVYSVNTTGTSASAIRRFTTLPSFEIQTRVPTDLRVIAVSDDGTTIDVAWDAPAGGIPNQYTVNVYQPPINSDIYPERLGREVVSGRVQQVRLRAGFLPIDTRWEWTGQVIPDYRDRTVRVGSGWNFRVVTISPRWFDLSSGYNTLMRISTPTTNNAPWVPIIIPAKPGTPYSVYADAGIIERGVVRRPPDDGINKTPDGFTVAARLDYNNVRLKIQQFEFQLLGSDNHYTTPIETRVVNAQDGTHANRQSYQEGTITYANLTNGQRYVVRITAISVGGSRRSESITTAIITLLGTNPAPPELLRIADVRVAQGNSTSEFTGRWVALSGAGGRPEGYDVQLSNERGILTDTLEVNTLDTKTPSYQFRNLSNEATYRFRVRSYNNNRTQFSPWTISPLASLQNLRAQDSLTLRMIYANSDGTTWRKQTNWNSRFDIDAWQGVVVENDRVVGLILTNNNMSSLSDSIRRLTALRVLSLRGNNITTFPAGIRQLRNLQVLDLDDNRLSGELGNLSELMNLQVARFHRNRLTSLASTVFGSATPLRVFNAENNELNALPATLLNATQLRILVLSNNQIASWSGNLSVFTGLQSVLFSNNRLTAIPTFTSNASTLLHFNMQSNRLSGTATTANASLATNPRITYLIDRQTLLAQANMADDIFTPMLMAKQDVLSASGVDAVVYPTPAQSEVFVRLAVRTGGLYRLAICNMQGQSVSAPYNEVLGVGEHTLRLPIHHLASGSYMLMLTSPANEGKPLRYPVLIVR